MSAGGGSPQVEADVRELLATCRTASLATVDDQGRPHAANVQFAADERLRLYWVSGARAAHSRHLVERPEIAATIYHPNDQPDQIRGLQLHGEAIPLEAGERARAWELYAAKFPFVREPPYRAAVEAQGFYRLTPAWWRWIDNRRGFGFKVERWVV